MCARRTLTTLALLLALSSTLLVLAYELHATGTTPISDLMPTHESADPNPVECGLPATRISERRVVSPSLTMLELVNDSSFLVTEYLIVDTIIDNEPRTFWAEFRLSGRASMGVQVSFSVPVSWSNIRVCKDDGLGIIEGMDPIMPVSMNETID